MRKPGSIVAGVVAVLAIGACVGAGCVPSRGRPIAGDDAPESFVGQSRLRELYVEQDGHLVSPILETPDLASRVAVWLSVSEDAIERDIHLEVRGTREDGRTTAWLAVEEQWADPVLGRRQRVARAELDELVVAVELRLPVDEADALAGLVWSALVPAPGEAADPRVTPSADGLGADLPARSLHSLISGIAPRSEWGARQQAGCNTNETKTWITVHHSVTALQATASRADQAAAVRGIQAYHMDGRGYCDIAYHFAVTADGTVWEGREARLLGAHTGSHNTNNAGIVFVGCFHPTSDCNGLGDLTPPQAMLDGGGTAIGNIARHYGIAINADNVIGHRDNPDQTTACPGDNLHALLETLRNIAANGTSVGATTGKVQGVVWDLSITTDASRADDLGAHLPGSVVRVAGGGSVTAREGDSYWSFDLPPGRYTLTATRDGFAPTTRDVQIAAGVDSWASIGIAPLPSAVDLTVRVVGSDTAVPLPNATVTVTGLDPAQTNADGRAQFTVAAGEVEVTAVAEGYAERTLRQTVAAGAPVDIQISLDPVVVGPGEGEGEGNAPSTIDRVTILPPEDGAGGCSGGGSAAGAAGAAGATGTPVLAGLLAGLFALSVRRGRGAIALRT